MAFPIFLSSAFIFYLLFPSSVVESKSIGFTLDLIHRDSPSSPFFNPSTTPSERLSNALLRSHKRANYIINSAANSPSSAVVPGGEEYLMNFTIGTPPVSILAVADTGSVLTWTQCAPCESCYKQTAPLFDPAKSSTYKEVSCGSKQCKSAPQTLCNANDTCQYEIEYADNSHTRGKVATETFGLGSSDGTPVSFPGITFGCGFDNGGTFSKSWAGIVGLGIGSLSLVSQLGSSVHGKFSYCLGSKSGKINFGDNAVVSGDRVVSSALVHPSNFYSLRLKGFSVGSQMIDFSRYSSDSQSPPANDSGISIIIDSGTWLTHLPSELYRQLEEGVKKAGQAELVKGILRLCYNTTSTGVKLPGLTAHCWRGRGAKGL